MIIVSDPEQRQNWEHFLSHCTKKRKPEWYTYREHYTNEIITRLKNGDSMKSIKTELPCTKQFIDSVYWRALRNGEL